jgi:hypothetical protein
MNKEQTVELSDEIADRFFDDDRDSEPDEREFIPDDHDELDADAMEELMVLGQRADGLAAIDAQMDRETMEKSEMERMVG